MKATVVNWTQVWTTDTVCVTCDAGRKSYDVQPVTLDWPPGHFFSSHSLAAHSSRVNEKWSAKDLWLTGEVLRRFMPPHTLFSNAVRGLCHESWTQDLINPPWVNITLRFEGPQSVNIIPWYGVYQVSLFYSFCLSARHDLTVLQNVRSRGRCSPQVRVACGGICLAPRRLNQR